ncbi:glycoside hydrolase family 2 [Massilia sp. Dwa41.01b]|uniref:glycoside hydrolase family 2 protein n=1 Tax=unclassified Massilia TaxID=2609279 RepID=UPI001602065C|nr:MULTISPECIES: glycoside hydrolase family 2 TIM barrel-domain containing protein [unclassified Massilia]QNA88293.1 glycoside hydrolase family 2 [Massilia sp. Dwa41.01b]QNA99191.1 glycoside hydrolase family 2 [Massilia sp. Se16.2.3]
MSQFEYPRPQLVRDNWISLNGKWRFCFDDAMRFKLPDDVTEWTHEIEVPFAPETRMSGIGDTGFHRVCWYEREFTLTPTDGRTILHFGAVDYAARVWVNGRQVAEHEGGHTPFSADITSAMSADGKQVVTVYVEDDPADLAKPRGKQDWLLEAHSIWYPRTTGIWQTVWVEQIGNTHIAKLKWTPIFETFEIGCEVFAGGDIRDDMFVEVKIWHGEQLLADDYYKLLAGEANRKIALSDPGIDDSRNELLWSPERPTLLDAEVTLRCNGQVLDRIRSYTALRSVAINRDRFMLNGRPYQLRLVLDQGYWPESFLTGPSDEHLRRDVELAKLMGFNGVRKHQKIEDPRYLYWADRLGLLVWEEMPSAYRFSPKAISRMVREWTEAIDRDYSHPCIIVWVAFNESWGVPNLTLTQAHRNAVEALYHLTRTLDSTRPVIGNDGWEASATDILGIHDYDCDPEKLGARYAVTDPVRTLFDQRRPGGRILTLDGFPHRGQPIVLTEFGGIAFDTKGTPEEGTWGYSRSTTAEGFHNLYRGLLKVVNETFMFSGFCYTQFADTFQEANGLLNADRTPKLPFEDIYAATRNLASVHQTTKEEIRPGAV